MFLLYALPVGLLAGLLLGGHLGSLGELRFRLAWLAVAGYLLQSVLFVPRVGRLVGDLGPLLYVLTNIAVLAAILANRRIRGIPLVAFGAALNLLVIGLNGGFMPADHGAYAAAGMAIDGYWNVQFVVDPVLPFLGDWIVLPSWLPGTNVISLGDVAIAAGLALVVALGMRGSGPEPVPTV